MQAVKMSNIFFQPYKAMRYPTIQGYIKDGKVFRCKGEWYIAYECIQGVFRFLDSDIEEVIPDEN